jgi:hypothetical protein
MRAGATGVFAKSLLKRPLGRWHNLPPTLVVEAPADEAGLAIRWPGWTALLLAVGGSGLGWFALISGALLLFRH